LEGRFPNRLKNGRLGNRPSCAKEGGTPGRFKSFPGKVLLASN